ncbi:MAG: response regulator [Nitrospirota bacterium]
MPFEEQHKKILLLDDDVNFLYSVQEILRQNGYQVTIKTQGADALSFFDKGSMVDAIIVDYKMPDMDGLKFLSLLKSKGQNIPVILLSAHGDIEIFFRALKLGAYAVINKPVSIRELTETVRSALVNEMHEALMG